MSSMEELRGLSTALNKASDDLNYILKNTEDQLRSLNLGVEAWVELPLATDETWKNGIESVWNSYYLGWSKLNIGWGLAIKKITFSAGFYHGDEDDTYLHKEMTGLDPLLTQGRNLKAKALPRMSELFFALKKEAEAILQVVGASVKPKMPWEQ